MIAGLIGELIAFLAAAYQAFAILACLFRKTPTAAAVRQPGGVSILKPVYGADPALRDAILSHMAFQGDYELLCGVSNPKDAATPLLRELTQRFPRVRIVETATKTANAKVGVLADLAAAARYPTIVVNDADIRVPPDYLDRVTAPLTDSSVGLVTCLYRPNGTTLAARFEGLGVSTDFAPSALVARWVGVDEFAMGSTLAFRRADLDRIGGFAAIGDYLADDYQLGYRIHQLGLKCVLSDVIVETSLSGDWISVWRHQVRWARTIRVSKPGGYWGLPVTNAALAMMILGLLGRWELAAAVLVLRLAMAVTAGWAVLRSPDALLFWWLVPLRDLFAFAVWVAGLFGNTVIWRDKNLVLDEEGRIR